MSEAATPDAILALIMEAKSDAEPSDPALQVFCFPYVYNRSLGIQILVNTGTFGKVQNDTLQVIICF